MHPIPTSNNPKNKRMNSPTKTTEKPKVSVVLPVYNTADYLEEAINSIRLQTLEDLEIIAVNDGSTDNSRSLLHRLSREEPRLRVYDQPNQGLSATRNNGLAHANGEFVYFLDSDDCLRSDALACCYEAAAEQGSDVVCFDGVFMTSPDTLIDTPPAYQRKGALPAATYSGTKLLERLADCRRYSSSPCLNLIRTSYLRGIGLQFYPGILHEDQLFTFLLYLQARRITFVPQDFFRRRMRAHSIMTSPVSMRNIDGYLTVCRELESFARHRLLQPEQHRLLHRQVRWIVGIAASTAAALPFGQRLRVLSRLAARYFWKLRPASAALLLMPCLKLKKNP